MEKVKLNVTVFKAIPESGKVFLVSYAIFLFWFVSAYPGLVSYDSIYTWSMIIDESWDSVIPISYLLLVKISSVLGSTALVTLVQVTLMAFSVSLLVNVFGSRLSSRQKYFVAGLASAFPANGILAVSMWKDSLFAPLWIMCICVVVLLQRSQRQKGTRFLLACLFALVLLATATRLNGFVILTFTVLPLAFLLIISKLRLLALSLISVAITLGFFLTNIFPVSFATIDTTRIANSTAPFYLDNAISWNKGAYFSEKDAILLESILPKEDVALYANCVAWDSLFDHFNSAPLASDQSQLIRMWLKTLINRPDLIIESRICRSESNLRPFPRLSIDSNGLADAGPIYKGQWSMPNDYGLGPTRPLPKLSKVAETLHSASITPRLTFVFYWGGFWFWILILATSVPIRKSKREITNSRGILIVAIGFAVSVAITNVSPDFRYMMPLQILSICLVAIKIIEKTSKGCECETT